MTRSIFKPIPVDPELAKLLGGANCALAVESRVSGMAHYGCESADR